MPDVEGEDWWQYTITRTPWSEGNTHDLPDALSFALRLGDGQQHFGFVPAELLASHGPAASSVIPVAPRTKRWVLLEYCCSETSLLCQDKYKTGKSRLHRLTKERDLTTASGIGYALSLVKRKGAGVPIVHAALPCTWGSSMQNLHKKRLGTDEKYQAHVDELLSLIHI